MSKKRSQDGWTGNPGDLSALYAAKEAEANKRIAAAFSSRRDQLRFQETFAARMAEATEPYELGRLLLEELTGTLGANHALLALVAESQFLEVLACTQVIVPRYQQELLEECFVVGERLELGATDGLDWAVPGSAELPTGVQLTAIPLFQADGKPLGALVIEGATRDGWLEPFLALVTTGLEDCVAYARIDQLIVDAVVAISSAHAAKVEHPVPQHGRHVRRVEELARQLAHAMGLPPTQTKRVRMTALLHDMEPATISQAFGDMKRGKLTGQLWRTWMDDPFVGGIYPSPLANFQKLVNELPLLRCRWDGKGNLSGTQGDDLPLATRVVAVAEAFENLTGLRAHRTTLSIPGALDQIRRLAGAQYDPAVVEALCTMFAALEIETRVSRAS
ncbi:MAG: metal dependent phosphohydrolase [Cyanobacteria bacterium RYN_339]|nr:metal dependent phosphohydrolase [Cyanobacteria bacterium RYN_339]